MSARSVQASIWVIADPSVDDTHAIRFGMPQKALGWSQMAEPYGSRVGTVTTLTESQTTLRISPCELCGEPSHGWFEVPMQTGTGRSRMRVCRVCFWRSPARVLTGWGAGVRWVETPDQADLLPKAKALRRPRP